MTQMFVKMQLKNQENGNFGTYSHNLLPSLLFSEHHPASRGNNHLNTVAREHGKRKKLAKEGTAFAVESWFGALFEKFCPKKQGKTGR